MMNNKGFTLVELIATIALLAIISVISFVSINAVIEKNKVSNCQSLVGNIKSAVKEYVSDNRYNSEFNPGNSRNVNITGTVLIENNYLNGEIHDSFTDELMDSDKIKVSVILNNDYSVSQLDVLYNEVLYDCNGTIESEID